MEFTLSLIADRSVVRESLKGIIWAIFFQRLFGPITPSMNEFFDIPYPMASDQTELDALIDDKVNDVIKRDFDNVDEIKLSNIVIQFFDNRATTSRKKSSWFGQRDDHENLKIWESWIINIKCLPMTITSLSSTTTGTGTETTNNTGNSTLTSMSNTNTNSHGNNSTHSLANKKLMDDNNIVQSVESFEETLNNIIDIVDNSKDHIPPITSLDSSPFPYGISTEKKDLHYDTKDDSWGKYIKKILD